MVFVVGLTVMLMGFAAGKWYIHQQCVQALSTRIRTLRDEVDLLINQHNDLLLRIEESCDVQKCSAEVSANA